MILSKVTITTLALVGGVLMSSVAARAQTTWHVDDDNCPGPGSGSDRDPFCSIQTCINMAFDGDTCLVQPGTYFENINFVSRAITLRSSGGAEVTTIDAAGSGTVVTCVSGELADTVLDGFTITNGSAVNGGGMLLVGSSPIVENCIFEHNEAVANFGLFEGLGGGMVCNGSSPTVMGCTFRHNTAVGGPSQVTGLGGGVSCLFESHPTIFGCTLTQNTAIGGGIDPSGHGGGLFAGGGSNPIVTDCMFDQNETIGTVWASGWGAGAYFTDGSPTVTNCTFRQGMTSGTMVGSGAVGGVVLQNGGGTFRGCVFENNVSANDLAGGMLILTSSPEVIDCTFTNNWSTRDQAGALAIVIGSNPKISGCKFLGNTSNTYGGALVVGGSSTPTIINSLFAGNTSSFGGAIWCGAPPGAPAKWFADATFINCTITDNVATVAGGGIYSTEEFGGSATTAVNNSIVWGNSPDGISEVAGAVSTVNYSDVQGGWMGEGNVNLNPGFVDADGADDDPTTLQDNNYRLSTGSSCIDAGNNALVASDTCDEDDDGDTAEPTPLDLDRRTRFVDVPGAADCPQAPGTCGAAPIVDAGSYEYCPSDLNSDGTVDAADLATLLGDWGPYQPCPPHMPSDFNQDCEVGAADLAQLLGAWGP